MKPREILPPQQTPDDGVSTPLALAEETPPASSAKPTPLAPPGVGPPKVSVSCVPSTLVFLNLLFVYWTFQRFFICFTKQILFTVAPNFHLLINPIVLLLPNIPVCKRTENVSSSKHEGFLRAFLKELLKEFIFNLKIFMVKI